MKVLIIFLIIIALIFWFIVATYNRLIAEIEAIKNNQKQTRSYRQGGASHIVFGQTAMPDRGLHWSNSPK